MKKFFSTTEFAKICQISRFTASKWVREGKIKATSLGRNYKIPAGEVIRFLEDSHYPVPEELKAEYQDLNDLQKYCWEYHSDEKSSHLHNCDTCLIKQAKILNCFIVRIDDYQEKIKCPIDCSKCSYFLQKFADHFIIVKAFDEPAIICCNGSVLAANPAFLRIIGINNDTHIINRDCLDFIADASRKDFLTYTDMIRANDPLRPEDVIISFVNAKGELKGMRLSCKRLKNIPNTFLVFFKMQGNII